MEIDPQRVEALGPAERIVQTLITWSDHMVHNRPGVIVDAPSTPVGVRWHPVIWVEENGAKVVYRLDKVGKRTQRVRIGVLGEDELVRDGPREVGRYRASGLLPEVAAWMYRQVAEVFALDNEFAAHWASWAFAQDRRDLKVVLAAFMLVQNRTGEPVRGDAGEVIFHDVDYRDVGEAMCLIRRRDRRDLHPKLLLRVGDLLALDEVAAINRELGFGRSARNPAMGRYEKAVTKWLRHREQNPAMLEGLVKSGFRRSVMQLARRVGYKPASARFFEILRWKQHQADDGRREVGLDLEIAAAETWEGLSEAQICERIVATRPNYKRIVGMLPSEIGLTRAIFAAAMEAGSLSDADLIIATPTLEELGLLEIESIRARWSQAVSTAENQRAARIAERVRDASVAEELQEAADSAVKKALEEVTADIRVYVMVDKSGSMDGAIDRAKGYLSRFLQGFPLGRTHVAVFNTAAREIAVQHASAAGVEHAFRGHTAGGGTDYGSAVRLLAKHQPLPGEDTLFLFVGDQVARNFANEVRNSGLDPVAFGLLEVIGSWGHKGTCVEDTAAELGIPCFGIDEDMFDDVYAVSRTLRHLVASTPVKKGASRGPALVEQILSTELLAKPVWA